MQKYLKTEISIFDKSSNDTYDLYIDEKDRVFFFLNQAYKGFYLNRFLIQKYSFDENFLYLVIGSVKLAFKRISGSDEYLKQFIRTNRVEKNDIETYDALFYMLNAISYGVVEFDPNTIEKTHDGFIVHDEDSNQAAEEPEGLEGKDPSKEGL